MQSGLSIVYFIYLHIYNFNCFSFEYLGADKRIALASLWSQSAPLGADFVMQIYQLKLHEPRVQLEIAPDGTAAAM